MLVYQREPHARQMAFEAIPQPTNYGERLALADRTQQDFDLACDIVVDAMDDRSRALFGDQPNSLILIGPDGVVRLKQPWADPDELETALPELLPFLGKQLLATAAREDATLQQRVAMVRADGDATDRAALRDELRAAAKSDSAAADLLLLFELDVFTAGADSALPLTELTGLARRRYAARPAAEAAYLTAILPQVTDTARAALLDRLVELTADDTRAREWIAAQR